MNTKNSPTRHAHLTGGKSLSYGFSLVELMIGMTLGLFIIGGVISVFVANQQAARTTEGLSRAQETSRFAFELITRNIREAGSNPCSAANTVLNPLVGPPVWSVWNGGLRGFDAAMALPAAPDGPPAAGAGMRIAGTDAITIMNASGTASTVIPPAPPTPPALPPAPDPTQFNLHDPDHSVPSNNIGAGDAVMVCDYEVTKIFTTATASDALVTVSAAQATAQPHSFVANSIIVPFQNTTWYIGQSNNNDPATNPARRSLYRINLVKAVPTREEIAENVTDMQITYLLPGATAYVPANAGWSAAQWNSVLAVQVALTLETPIGVNERVDDTLNADANNDGVLENVATADINEQLTARRTLTHTVTIRSRAP